MGAIEEGGRAVTTFMDALKAQPLALALVVMNFALLAYLFWTGREMTLQRNQYVLETQQLLSKCINVEDFEKLQRGLRSPP